MISARNDLHEFAYAVMHALRDDHVAEEVGEDAAEDIADKVTDAIDWLDDHEDDDECACLVVGVSVVTGGFPAAIITCSAWSSCACVQLHSIVVGTVEEVLEQKTKLAEELKGFLGILGVSTDAKKVVMGPTVHSEKTAAAGGAATPAARGSKASEDDPIARAAATAAAGGPAARDGYQRGPNGCIIVDVDDYV